MTVMQTRKTDTTRLAQQATHSMAMKQAQRRRKGMQEELAPVRKANFIELCYDNRSVVFQIDPDYMAKRRIELKRRPEFKITTLLSNAESVMQALNHQGMTAMRTHSAQISFAYAHAGRSAVDFLTLYFAENPHIKEINRRFYAARWTEEFTADELHTAYLNAICIMESMSFWNTTMVPVSH